MSDQSRTDREREIHRDDLDAEVLEDLEVEDEADGVEGGTLVGTGGCPSMGCVAN